MDRASGQYDFGEDYLKAVGLRGAQQRMAAKAAGARYDATVWRSGRFGRRLVDQRGRVGYGFEAILRDGLARDFADPICTILDSAQGSFDLCQQDAVHDIFIRLD